jgi:CARDB protein
MKLFTLIFLILLTPLSLLFAASDLEIQSLRGTPNQKKFTMEFQITNHGPASADHLGCNIYFYANERLLVSQTFPLQPLAAGASRKESQTMDLPGDSSTTVKVEIFDSQQPDTQPSTNFLQMNLRAPDLKKADLQIIDVKSDEEGGKFRAAWIVRLRNNGPDRIPATSLIADLVVQGETIGEAERKVDRLIAGEETQVRIPLPNAPVVSATNGDLVFKWTTSEVQDIDQTNQIFKINVPLNLKMPDLVPVKPAIDKNGVLTFQVTNQGSARAGSSVTALYINGALVQRYNTPEIAARGSQNYKYNADPLDPDTKVVVITDFNAEVEESSEENNRASLPSVRK